MGADDRVDAEIAAISAIAAALVDLDDETRARIPLKVATPETRVGPPS